MKDPYKYNEKQIMDHLVRAMNLFEELETTHVCHKNDFIEGIHKCQNVLIHRIVQRDYPHEFPVRRRKTWLDFLNPKNWECFRRS